MNEDVFFSSVRRGLFGGALKQAQVDGLNHLLRAFGAFGDGRPKSLAYILASVHHETGSRWEPVRETFAPDDATARRRVASRPYGKPLGGHVYYGRGYIQITWRDNYAANSATAGVDLVAKPDAAMIPEISAKIAVVGVIDGRFNGQRKGIAHYLPTDGPDDLKNARRTVNVTDRWEMIGGYYQRFLAAVEAAWTGEGAPVASGPDPEALAAAQLLVSWFASAPEGAREWIKEMPT